MIEKNSCMVNSVVSNEKTQCELSHLDQYYLILVDSQLYRTNLGNVLQKHKRSVADQ